MTASLPALRRQLRELQRHWKLQDWDIDVKLVDRLPGTDNAQVVWDRNDRTAIITLARTVPPEKEPMSDLSEMLAHEFAHILTADLHGHFIQSLQNESVDWQAACRSPWDIAMERFCNVFAEAVTKEVS